MRQKDIAIIGAVVIFSTVLSVLVSKYMFAKPQNRQQQVEVVQAISPNFDTPDSRYFNANSVDATTPIQIGNNSNPDPFREAPKP